MGKHRFFKGTEAEGSFAGIKTLFIPATAMNSSLCDFSGMCGIAKAHGCGHIYLGASGDFFDGAMLASVAESVASRDDFLWTIETDFETARTLPGVLTAMRNLRVIVTVHKELDVACFKAIKNLEFKVDGRNDALVFRNFEYVDTTYVHDEEIRS